MDGWQAVSDQDNLHSVVVDDFDVKSVASLEAETYSPLIVDADAPLSLAISLQGLQSVRGRKPQILNQSRGVQLCKPPACTRSNLGREAARPACSVEPFCFRVGERSNHESQHKHCVYGGQAGQEQAESALLRATTKTCPASPRNVIVPIDGGGQWVPPCLLRAARPLP